MTDESTDPASRGGGMTEEAAGLGRLVDHLEWANRKALAAVRDAGSGEGLRLLSHVLAAERVWLRRLETGDSSGLEIWPELSAEECEELLQRNVAAFRRLLDSFSGDDRDEEVSYRNSKGREFRTPAGEILFHVLLHGSHHRGQIAVRLRDAGKEPVDMDFITFVRERPA